MAELSPYALGATLYMPATRADLLEVVVNNKIPQLQSLVICLEDAVSESDIDYGIKKLKELLRQIDKRGGKNIIKPLVFIRPRNIEMANRLNDWNLITHLDGFVIPKLNLKNLISWSKTISSRSLMIMPTLETSDMFDPIAVTELRDGLENTLKSKILALRIGGNDLMGVLGLRRSPDHTLYKTPMGYTISMLASIMGSAGYSLTAPVFEQIYNRKLLEKEIELDLLNGLVGKTAIHPYQIPIIQNSFRVSPKDLNSAKLIMDDSAKAVFKHDGAMCEPATHLQWAKKIIERAQWHGIKNEKKNQDCYSDIVFKTSKKSLIKERYHGNNSY